MTRPRRGYALIEMILVIGALVVILGLCASLIHLLMRLDRASRDHLAESGIRERLARQLRSDVRAASTAKVGQEQPGAAGPNWLVLHGPGDRVINYVSGGGGIIRTEHDGPRLVRQEAYRLPSKAVPRFAVRAERGSDFVVLELVRKPAQADMGRPRVAEYVALLGREARLAGRPEVTP